MTDLLEVLEVEFREELEGAGYQMTEALVRASVSQYLKARIRKLERLEAMTPAERRRQLRKKRDHGRETRAGVHVPTRLVQVIKEPEPRPSELRIIEPAEVWGPPDPDDDGPILGEKAPEERLDAIKRASERRQDREDVVNRFRR